MEVSTKIQMALEISDSKEYASIEPILSDVIWKSVADSMKDVRFSRVKHTTLYS